MTDIPLRDQLARCTADAMLGRMRDRFPAAPWSEDVLDMEAHRAAAVALLAAFDISPRGSLPVNDSRETPDP